MKKYEAVIILNPNLSSKVDTFIKDFEKLLKDNTFVVKKMEDIGRRQLSYSINNHNKGHYLIFNIEGNATNLIDIEYQYSLLTILSSLEKKLWFCSASISLFNCLFPCSIKPMEVE